LLWHASHTRASPNETSTVAANSGYKLISLPLILRDRGIERLLHGCTG
jgi:hypothetical protein